jgi:hypothetical protein
MLKEKIAPSIVVGWVVIAFFNTSSNRDRLLLRNNSATPAGLRQLYVAEIKPYHYASVFEKVRP